MIGNTSMDQGKRQNGLQCLPLVYQSDSAEEDWVILMVVSEYKKPLPT